jgi:hypothetical protein
MKNKRKIKDNKQQFNLLLPKRIIANLKKESKETGLTISELIRKVLYDNYGD